jgi:hypothetical protein
MVVAALAMGIIASAGSSTSPRTPFSSPTPTHTVVVTLSPPAPAVSQPAVSTPPTPVDHNFTTEAPPGITPSILVGTSWVLSSYAGVDGITQRPVAKAPKLAISTTGDVRADDGCNPITGGLDVTAIGNVNGTPARQFAFYGGVDGPRSCASQPVIDLVLVGEADGVAEMVTATIRNNTLTLYRPGAGRLVYTAGTVSTH